MANSTNSERVIEKKRVSHRKRPILDYLEPDGRDFSIENLDLLRKTFETDRAKMVSFVGAGASKPLGVRDWRSMMGELVSAASDSLRTKYNEFANDSGDEVIRPESYPGIAQEIFEDLGYIRYNEVIKTQIEHITLSTSPTLEYLVLAVRKHLTTNFETCIENSYERLQSLMGSSFDRSPEIRYYRQATLYPSDTNADWICYLHADLSEEPPIFILHTAAYNDVYLHAGGTTDVHDCIKNFYMKGHIVFLGFSFEDPFVMKCIQEIANEERRNQEIYSKHFQQHGRATNRGTPNQKKHFLLIDSGAGSRMWHRFVAKEKSKFFNHFQEINIFPIVYRADNHIFLQYLFEELGAVELET